MYHDQGHSRVTVPGIEAGANITGVRLPVIRTSVAHGTAFVIADRAIADSRSMLEALRQGTSEAFEQKHAIARWAAAVIVPVENILLDAGSTVDALAHELRGFEKLSMTTPGINIMQEPAESQGIEVDCLGGRLRNRSQSFVGPLAESGLERMSFDRMFLDA